MPIGDMYDTWISGSYVNSFCCYGLVHLLDSEKPNRRSFTFTFTYKVPAKLDTATHRHTSGLQSLTGGHWKLKDTKMDMICMKSTPMLRADMDTCRGTARNLSHASQALLV